MAKSIDQNHDKEDDGDGASSQQKKKKTTKLKNRELSISCMLNTEVGAVLAVIRRVSDPNSQFTPEDNYDSSLINSLKSLRALIFKPEQEWHTIDPSIYLAPFLDVIQSDDIPASATGVCLSAILKILKLEIFNEKTPGARDAINSVVTGITNCRLEKTDPNAEDAVLMRILQLLSGVMRNRTSILLTDHAVCTLVNSCFQVVQQSASKGDLLQCNARHTMHELIQTIFARLPDIEDRNGENSESDAEDAETQNIRNSEYGARCAVDIFHFLCSLLNVVEVVDMEGSTATNSDEDVQLFALILINSAIELSGEGIGKYPKLLRTIQDDLFYHLIYYGTCSSPLLFSMICSTVLNIYHFLRRSIRLQLEAFFTYVLLRVASGGNLSQLQEVALEGIISFCRQPTFIIEMYVNYDCDSVSRNVFEEIGKLLCKRAFPGANNPLSSMQIQAFEALLIIIHSIADNMDEDEDSRSSGSYPVIINEYRPFWTVEGKNNMDMGSWVEFLRVRKTQKRKIMVAADHFNRDEKKGLDYLKVAHLVPETPDPKALACFYRFTPGLDKNKIGDFLGDPDEFNIQVLKEFTDTFDFSGIILDTALRTFLEAFRLPGESQKIHRILEAFSERFYDQQSSEIFVSKDAVFILCYSVIMLNTDQHNPQVKKKMTEEEFIRNNRAINGGKDLPREYLSELFQSISNNAITLFGMSSSFVEMNTNKWVDLINRSKVVEPFIICNFNQSLGRDMFASISGPAIAALSATFEHADEDEILHECIEGLFSVARISRFGLEETLDALLASFCKFTLLLNPYATAEETLYAFSNDLKSRMATLAVFTVANKFGDSIRGGWRNIVDCLLKLKRLKLLPQSVVEPDTASTSSSDILMHSRSESGVIFPSTDTGFGSSRQMSGLIGRFSHFLSLDTEDSLTQAGSELEQNLKIVQQCRIGNLFSSSSNLPDDSIYNLGRSLIFAAAGKGQKFSTSVEEEETVGFCWDLLITITLANLHRFPTFWPCFHDYLLVVTQFPLFSPCPFAEKAIMGLFKVCLKLLGSYRSEKLSEDLIFKSINLMWKLEKEILDTCCNNITQSVSKILTEYPANIQTQLGWKSVLHLLSVAGRHPETYDQGTEALIMLMSDRTHVSRTNYAYCIDCAFGYAALKISPLEKSWMILDLMADSVKLLIQWYQNDYSDPGSNISNTSNTSSSSFDDSLKALNSSNSTMNLFIKLAESLRKTSLVRREEIRNHAVVALQRSFRLAEDLGFTATNCINCFNLVIFSMVDDLHEKMIEYSRRENSVKEMRSMTGTLKLAMELLKEVFLQFLKPLSQNPGFRTFWLGVLRRMDTCMKGELGDECESILLELVPVLLKDMITKMKDKEILVHKEDNDLWDITYIQIQWIAPSLKEELFPEEQL